RPFQGPGEGDHAGTGSRAVPLVGSRSYGEFADLGPDEPLKLDVVCADGFPTFNGVKEGGQLLKGIGPGKVYGDRVKATVGKSKDEDFCRGVLCISEGPGDSEVHDGIGLKVNRPTSAHVDSSKPCREGGRGCQRFARRRYKVWRRFSISNSPHFPIRRARVEHWEDSIPSSRASLAEGIPGSA